MKSVYALIPAALLAGTVLAAPAEAKRGEDPGTHAQRLIAQKKHFKTAQARKPGTIRKTAGLKKPRKVASTEQSRKASLKKPLKVASLKKRGKVAAFNEMTLTKTLRSGPRQAAKLPRQVAKLTAGKKMTMSDQALAINGAGDMRVASIIREMAPSYGVPTWFALRIAKVESGYNPYARGRAGEIGIYQLKCQTARGMGFEGDCSALTDARVNVRWGLKHLSLAIASSGGNLRLAASKHNGGLGRKSLVHSYIAKVF